MSSSNDLVGEVIRQGGIGVQEETARLLQGESITVNMDEQIVFSQLYRKPGAIWSLLMAAGYVKPLSWNYLSRQYKITLTNLEVHLILEELISEWFTLLDTGESAQTFCEALLADTCPKMNEILNRITNNTFSFFDTAKPEPERFYHAFVLGLIVHLKEQYEIRSNRESGYGRYDVCLFPKKPGDRGIVLEFKTLKADKEKDLHETCAHALMHIREKDYTQELKARNVAPQNIYVYGFGFEGKKVLICGGAYETIDWETVLNTTNA